MPAGQLLQVSYELSRKLPRHKRPTAFNRGDMEAETPNATGRRFHFEPRIIVFADFATSFAKNVRDHFVIRIISFLFIHFNVAYCLFFNKNSDFVIFNARQHAL